MRLDTLFRWRESLITSMKASMFLLHSLFGSASVALFVLDVSTSKLLNIESWIIREKSADIGQLIGGVESGIPDAIDGVLCVVHDIGELGIELIQDIVRDSRC